MFAAFLFGLMLLVAGCTDDTFVQGGSPLIVEEGLEGTLSVTVGENDFEQRVTTRSWGNVTDEQHVHSVYLFLVDMQGEGAENCKIIAHRYFPDVTEMVKPVTVGEKTLQVVELSMKAVSSQKARIFAIANIGHSDLQHVANDKELLAQCDKATRLKDLQDLYAELSAPDENGVRVERAQGHLLMSGFFADCSTDGTAHYLSTSAGATDLTLKREENGTLSLFDAATGDPFIAIGTGAGGGKQGAVVLQRLDAKVSFEIKPIDELAETDGAFFELTSWQVMNVPVGAPLCWSKETPRCGFKESKVFRRNIAQTPDGGYTFTFYQFENYMGDAGGTDSYTAISGTTIAGQYNMQKGEGGDITVDAVRQGFAQGYPNIYSKFAYSLREQQMKVNEDGTPYEPEKDSGEGDQTVKNGEYQFAPKNGTYVRLTGNYYNPAEPVRRRKDDPRNKDFPGMSLEMYPYWSLENQPVATREEAAKRFRAGEVSYVVHLGYVGGGNYNRTTDPLPGKDIKSLEEYEKKVNDYNVLRNHHYTYTIGISGVENIKVEATREDGGNAYGQENQPGSEGMVLEAQHMFSVDAHFDLRTITVDFERMPVGVSTFGFFLSTPYEKDFRVSLKRKENGTYAIFDSSGKEMTDIRGHDLDWIHFAWHGTEDEPSRSLIDEETGNGIAYSDTYGGYVTQQSYNDPTGELQHEKDAEHPYYLMNSVEFVMQVWDLYQRWLAKGRPAAERTATYTVYVNEFHYDRNPLTGANVDWTTFAAQPPRSALYFVENVEHSADGKSLYTDAHIVITQKSIQTPYATSTAGGQSVAEVAFGIEHLDEFECKYNNSEDAKEQYLKGTDQTANGLFNTMCWFYEYRGNKNRIPTWEQAEIYFNAKEGARIVDPNSVADCTGGDKHRQNRRAAWAVYSRNRDLNRDGILQANEIRWFVPTIEQYTICYLAGRAAFEHPLYEPERAHRVTGVGFYLEYVPFIHYMADTSEIFWAEEGCSNGLYGNPEFKDFSYHSIRMARMFTRHGIVDDGSAIPENRKDTTVLFHDPVYIISETRNGQAITDYRQLVDGRNYYVTLNKLNPMAFRDYFNKDELGLHDHEGQNNWLYREFKIARNKIGYTSFDKNNKDNYDRTPKINGIPRTWWQLNGVWSPDEFKNLGNYYYAGRTVSIAYDYMEEPSGSDLHKWRLPNLREAAVMSQVFPDSWFCNNVGKEEGWEEAITTRTRAGNLGPNSTNIPYYWIRHRSIIRLDEVDHDRKVLLFVRPVHDVGPGNE